ncbi:hypothetical protein LZK73_21765 [Neorhizobium galegae]|nr:hypothetical protein LZK73_21765 [Neorhizobium galegae]
MTFVIKRKSDGKFAKGRTVYSAEWVDDLSEARVYPTKGNATTSLRYTFNRLKQYQRTQALAEDQYEIVKVAIVTADRLAALQEDSNWLGHLENAGVDNWSGISFAYDLRREAEAE